jgi:hypothetical protein
VLNAPIKTLSEKAFCDANAAMSIARFFEFTTGLPDGLFSSQKSQFGKYLQGLRLENVDIFYGHLEYFMDIRVIL